MNILHALAWYFPESSGGTEVYVEALVRELRAFGMESRILAAADDGVERSYAHAGTPVSRYPAPPPPDRVETVRGERPPPGFERFRAGLGQQRDVEIYHQHSWTTACGLHHLETARALGFKTVLTVHVPSNLCLRGTMLLFGDRPCDGRIEETRCAACWANGRGLPVVAAWALARLPLALSERAARVRQPSRWATALAARALARDKQRQFARMAAAADRIVAVCDWLRVALRLNGIPESRLTLSRQGVSEAWPVTERRRRAPDAPFRLGFLGRWHPTKGIQVLLDALRRLPPELPLELVIHAMAGGEEDRRYRDALLAAHGPDRRLRVEPPVSRDRIPSKCWRGSMCWRCRRNGWKPARWWCWRRRRRGCRCWGPIWAASPNG